MSDHENETPRLASEYGRRKIGELKERHPSKAHWIDEEVRKYLADDSIPPSDDELVSLLHNVLEPSGAGSSGKPGGGRRGGGGRRRDRR